MTWQDFRINYHTSSYELAAFKLPEETPESDTFHHLAYWMSAISGREAAAECDDPWMLYAAEVHQKILRRGTQTFPQLEVEEAIKNCFFSSDDFVQPESEAESTCRASSPLQQRRGAFADFALAVSLPLPDFNPLDPDNPQNESRLLEQLYKIHGPQIGAYVHAQVPLDLFFDSQSFSNQRADFVLSLPNNRGLILEPGDHGDSDRLRDAQRDKKFLEKMGFQTLRPRNQDINAPDFERELRKTLKTLGTPAFVQNKADSPLREYSGFFCPALINRIECCLVSHLLLSNLWSKESVVLHIIERDIECSGLALASFMSQQEKIHLLFGKPFLPPALKLVIHSPRQDRLLHEVEARLLSLWKVSVTTATEPTDLIEADLTLDAAVMAGSLLAPFTGPFTGTLVAIRNAPRHAMPVCFPSNAMPHKPAPDADLGPLLEPFLRDLFRKQRFRDGQIPILRCILGNQDTIGLLPTGAGKSICYQLAGMLRPGTTLIICPIIALMDDQVEGLRTRHRIGATRAIHSGGPQLKDQELIEALEGSCFLFVAPERFQRQRFRDALRNATLLSRQRVSLAVIDEAHCVSMWGHDFRPAYLLLPANLRQFATSTDDHPPPMLALTGTASQMVLIDLKRILEVQSQDHIIRPRTFARRELKFRVIQCPMGKDTKVAELKKTVFPQLQQQLGVSRLLEESCGIVFDYAPKKLWSLVGAIAPKYQADLGKYGNSQEWESSPVGMYTGAAPFKAIHGDASHSLASHWDAYKSESFKRFSRGKTRCLFGNSAVSVGIDNPNVRYVVNVSMPQSMEDYYQQAGRAGRSGKTSYCYLLFSEGKPDQNDAWFLGQGQPEEYSDVATAQYYFQKNFPGKAADAFGLDLVLRTLLRLHKDSKNRTVRFSALALEETAKKTHKNTGQPPEVIGIDDSQRFLGHLILLGILEDYTLEGMKGNSVVCAFLHPDFATPLEVGDWSAVQEHVTQSLLAYYRRYYPKREQELRDEIIEIQNEAPQGRFLTSACQHLTGFVYDKIAYQRRNAIKDITEFCRLAKGDEERAAQIIRNYFDSTRFSEELLKMRELEPDYDWATGMLRSVMDVAEAEQLFWESSRLLSETERGDWSLIRTSIRIYLNSRLELASDELVNGVALYGELFVLAFASVCSHMVENFQQAVWTEILANLMERCYQSPKLRSQSLAALDHPHFPPILHGAISPRIYLLQLRQINEYLLQHTA